MGTTTRRGLTNCATASGSVPTSWIWAADVASRLLASRGEVTGMDISPVRVDRARALVPGGRFICDDMCSVEFPVGSFDAVVSFYSIIHVPVEEQEALFRRIAGWLKPGGFFMGTLGSAAGTDTERDWLGVEGATMYWSHADAQTYRRWLWRSRLRGPWGQVRSGGRRRTPPVLRETHRLTLEEDSHGHDAADLRDPGRNL